jgi:hypothetical protein
MFQSARGRNPSAFASILSGALARLRATSLLDSFTFIINGAEIVVGFDEAVILCPKAHQHLAADFSLRTFVVEDENINPTHFGLLQQLIAGESFTMRKDMRRSLILLCQRLGNVELEQLLFGLTLPLNSSPSGEVTVNLWNFAASGSPLAIDPRLFYRYTGDDLDVLDLATLNDILSDDRLRLENEDSLVRILFDLGPGHSSLFHHVRFEFLTADGIADFADNFDYTQLTREIWEHLLVRLKNVRDPDLEGRRFVGATPRESPPAELPPARATARVVPGLPPPPLTSGRGPAARTTTGAERPIPPPRQGSAPPPAVAPGTPPGAIPQSALRFNSRIITETPSLFAPIGGAVATLLYRGSRDGFTSQVFHEKCDQRSNTVVVIESTNGSVFGGFSPCEWDSSLTYKEDASGRSFLFTLENPHRFPPTAFPLKEDKRQFAIYCFPSGGPVFGAGCDIFVSHEGSSDSKSSTRGFGDTYENTTDLDGRTFFTGERMFLVKEIEVFEITG